MALFGFDILYKYPLESVNHIDPSFSLSFPSASCGIENIKGEIVLVVDGNHEEVKEEVDYQELVNNLIKKGYTKRDAILEISDKYNVSKNKIYNMVKE